MLVDLGRNDLSRVCRPGTVQRGALPRAGALLARDAPRLRGRRASSRRRVAFRAPARLLPRRNRLRRAEGARDADHLGARGLPARPLRGRGPLRAAGRGARHVHRDPNDRPARTASRYLQAGAGIVADSDPAPSTRSACASWPRSRPRSSSRRPRMILLDRQLRLVHLQPRAPVRRARRGGGRAPERRDRRRRGGAARAVAPRRSPPAPGRPAGAGVSVEIVRRLGERVPTLGVCLGHQAIVEAFGGEVGPAQRLVHGKASGDRRTTGAGSSQGCRSGSRPAATTRSRRRGCPTASRSRRPCADGEVMAVRHRELPVDGVQFHPESVLTPRSAPSWRATSWRTAMTSAEALARLLDGHDLSREQARDVMDEVMHGEATPAQIGGFLVALRLKGETADEIAGCAEAMRAHVLRREAEARRPRGHRRDGRRRRSGRSTSRPRRRCSRRLPAPPSRSTATARSPPPRARQTCSRRSASRSSCRRSGSSARSTSSASASCSRRRTTRRCGTRRRCGASSPPRTVFNVLGPLTNPAGARAQVRRRLRAGSGADDRGGARAARRRGARSSSTARAGSTSCRRPGRTSSARSSTGAVHEREIDPLDLGVPRCDPDELRGGSPEENAAAIRAVFAGEEGGRALRRASERGRRDRRRRPRCRPARRPRAAPVRRSTPARRRPGSTS